MAPGDLARLERSVKLEAELGGETIAVEVTGEGGRYRVAVEDAVLEVDARQVTEGIWSLLIGGVSHVVDVTDQDGASVVEVDGERYSIRVEEETRYIIRTRGGKAAMGGQALKAPMPGKVVQIEVEVGQAVQPGDGLIVLEAMKMENELAAERGGTVSAIHKAAGQAVDIGDLLVEIG
jgi:biotin carboxyl carrier protein